MRSEIKKCLESRMLGNLHVRFGIGGRVQFPALHHQEFKMILKSSGVKPIRTLPMAPHLNAHAERYVLSCKRDCLNHLLIFGLNRLQHVVDCYTIFFNEHRPHQGIGNIIPVEYNKPDIWQVGSVHTSLSSGNVTRKDLLGGLLQSYQRAA